MVEADNAGKEVGIKMGELIIPNAGTTLMNILTHIIIQAEITCFNKQSV